MRRKGRLMPDSKTVFALRKEGKAEEALKIARRCYKQDPKEIWNVRALGWSLHDAIKLSSETKQRNQLIDELLKLPVDEESDEILFKQCQRWKGVKSTGSDVGALIRKCTQLRKSGELKESAEIAQDLLEKDPQNPYVSSTAGWVYWSYLKLECDNEKPRPDVVQKCLEKYQALPVHEKPSGLHSQILRLAIRATKANSCEDFPRFYHWWGNEKDFQKEDFVPYQPEGEGRDSGDRPRFKRSSLVESAAGVLKNSLSPESDPGILEWALEIFTALELSHPKNEWISFWKSKPLRFLGRMEEARKLLLGFTRKKTSESWVWTELAQTYPVNDPNHLALLSQAALCGSNQEENYSLTTYKLLAEALEESGKWDEALHFLLLIQEARSKSKWSTTEVEEWMSHPEYQGVTAVPDMTARLNEYSKPAQEALIEGLPNCPGLYLGNMKRPYGKPDVIQIGLMVDDGIQVSPLPRGVALPENSKPGAPLQVTYDSNAHNKLHVSKVEKRQGEHWDGFKPKVGIVDHINREKHLTCVEIHQKTPVLLHHDRFPGSKTHKPGDLVEVYCVQPKGSEKYQVFHYLNSNPEQPIWVKMAEGEFTQSDMNPFGFVEAGSDLSAFVPPNLVRKHQLVNGQQVKVLMVIKWNRKRFQKNWAVIKVMNKS